jgi:hypothetical protein
MARVSVPNAPSRALPSSSSKTKKTLFLASFTLCDRVIT